jgi:hypothetical protein
MTRTKLIDLLEAYFEKHGEVSLSEYKKADTPVNSSVIKKAFGSWSGALRYINARKRRKSLTEPTVAVETANEKHA